MTSDSSPDSLFHFRRPSPLSCPSVRLNNSRPFSRLDRARLLPTRQDRSPVFHVDRGQQKGTSWRRRQNTGRSAVNRTRTAQATDNGRTMVDACRRIPRRPGGEEAGNGRGPRFAVITLDSIGRYPSSLSAAPGRRSARHATNFDLRKLTAE